MEGTAGIHLKYTGGGGSTDGLTWPSGPGTNGFAGTKKA